MMILDKRRITSWMMLSVFIPMLLLSSLHIHHTDTLSEDECIECINHVPHAGHLTNNTACLSDCVLCQFMGLSFLTTAFLLLDIIVFFITTFRKEYVSIVSFLPAGIKSPRAPPYSF